MQQGEISKYFNTTMSTTSSSVSTDAGDEADLGGATSEEEQESDSDLGPPPAKRAYTKAVADATGHHWRSGFNPSWLKELNG